MLDKVLLLFSPLFDPHTKVGKEEQPGENCSESVIDSQQNFNHIKQPLIHSQETEFPLAPSPIYIRKLEKDLHLYDESEAVFLLNGFKTGFLLQYKGPRKATESNNLKSAKLHPDIVREKN